MTLADRLPGRRARIAIGVAVVGILVLLGFTVGPGLRSVLGLILVLSIFAVAYGVLLGFANQPSLGQSLFFGLGAYSVILPIVNFEWGFWQVVGLALGLGLVAALLVGAVAVRLTEAYHVIVTALFASVANLAANNFTPITGGEGGLSTQIPPVPLGPLSFSVYEPVQHYLLTLAFAAGSYLFFYVLVRSPVGTVWQAIRDNEARAVSAGYNVYAYKLLAFTIAGAFTALSGALYAVHLRYASSEFFGLSWSVIPFLWVLIGGIGTLAGPLVGVALFTIFQFYVSQLWTHYLILFGILMIVVLRWAPLGIVGYAVQLERPGWAPRGVWSRATGRFSMRGQSAPKGRGVGR
jgi:branched-chain amino acid transport system permease protein